MNGSAALLKVPSLNVRQPYERVPDSSCVMVDRGFAQPIDGSSRKLILVSSDSGVSRILGCSIHTLMIGE